MGIAKCKTYNDSLCIDSVWTRHEPVIDSLVFSERPAGYCLGFRGEDYSARIPRVQQYSKNKGLICLTVNPVFPVNPVNVEYGEYGIYGVYGRYI